MLKFHLIAITSIVAIITVMFYVSGALDKPAPPPAPVEQIGDRYIQISKAHWGRNCNKFLEGQNRQLERQGRPPRYELVRDNNALRVVSSLCNGKRTCELEATADALGIDPIPSCTKMLEVEYRCFAFDRPWFKDVMEPESLTIDCSNES